MSAQTQPPPGFISPRIGRHRHFFADLAPSHAPGVAVACGGWEQCAPDYVVERSHFPFQAIEFVSQGKGWLNLPGRQARLCRGSLFSYGRDTPHWFCSDPDDPMVKYFVDFSGRDAPALVADLQRAGTIQVARADVIQEWFEQLLDAGEQAGPGAARICALLGELIVRHAMANPLRTEEGAGAASLVAYERCRAALRKNFLRLASAGELARACHLDIAYMTRLFRRYGNESPYQMLVRLKMNRAAERLVTTGLPLKEIGEEVGFTDPYHFSRVFKRVYGLAPKVFRDGYHRGTTEMRR
ncbi:DNA-binding domain-containing protein, AraC-type [Opitutaceae bacterium TAV1]|nr:histidine kinase [Opitutaceae bacterium TAV5]EIP97428.1 DNA-binding domain-containing protein, AraC-type [Opitutaceae bacterium TAV1]